MDYMRWTRKFLYIMVGIWAPLLIVIVTLELVFGTWIRENEWDKTRDLNIVRDARIEYEVSNIFGEAFPTVTYTRDKYGLRGSCSNPKDIKILTIGGSTTDQRYIPDGKTYQDILQSLLTKNTGRKICVANAGVDGHSTFGHIESFRTWFPLIEGLRPDYILFYLGINDAAFRKGPNQGFDNDSVDHPTWRNTLRRHSAFYDALRNLKAILVRGKAPAYAGHTQVLFKDDIYQAFNNSEGVDRLIIENTKNFEQRFKTLITRTQFYGAIPICVSQPHLMTKDIKGIKRGIEQAFEYEDQFFNGLDYDASIKSISTLMQKLCSEADGFYIDAAQKQFRQEDFYDLVHMTTTGVRQLGEYLFQEFLSQEIAIPRANK
jgi:hypothetical protein